MLLLLIGLTVLYGLMSLVALIAIAGALLSSVRRAIEGTPALSPMLPRRPRDLAKSNGFAACVGRRNTW
jgi:cation transporter-like permease